MHVADMLCLQFAIQSCHDPSTCLQEANVVDMAGVTLTRVEPNARK
jgi:hypothetical protein